MLKDTIEELKKRLKELEDLKNKFNELEKLILSQDNSKPGIDLDALKNKVDISDLEKLKDELLNTLVSKEDFNQLEKRVEAAENHIETIDKRVGTAELNIADHSKELEKINDRLNIIEQQLMNKVNNDQIDKLLAMINQIKAAGSNQNTKIVQSTGPSISQNDLNKLKEALDKIAEMEAQLDSLSK